MMNTRMMMMMMAVVLTVLMNKRVGGQPVFGQNTQDLVTVHSCHQTPIYRDQNGDDQNGVA